MRLSALLAALIIAGCATTPAIDASRAAGRPRPLQGSEDDGPRPLPRSRSPAANGGRRLPIPVLDDLVARADREQHRHPGRRGTARAGARHCVRHGRRPRAASRSAGGRLAAGRHRQRQQRPGALLRRRRSRPLVRGRPLRQALARRRGGEARCPGTRRPAAAAPGCSSRRTWRRRISRCAPSTWSVRWCAAR